MPNNANLPKRKFVDRLISDLSDSGSDKQDEYYEQARSRQLQVNNQSPSKVSKIESGIGHSYEMPESQRAMLVFYRRAACVTLGLSIMASLTLVGIIAVHTSLLSDYIPGNRRVLAACCALLWLLTSGALVVVWWSFILSVKESWIWDLGQRVIPFLVALYALLVAISVVLCFQVYGPILRCGPEYAEQVCKVLHEKAFQVYVTTAIASGLLFFSVAFVSFTLRNRLAYLSVANEL